jgi:DNA-directed RNA polymerase subunit RPC12/RpoP
MKKNVICTKCRKTFTVHGNRGSMREVDQPVTCPYCGEPNEVLWPMDMGFTVEKLSE